MIYKEFGNKIAFHPGYYIKEYIEEVGLTQEDFAKRLGTTPKNISYLVRGEQSVSIDIAYKLARLLGTSPKYWLNLQNEYDSLLLEFRDKEELEEEKLIFKNLMYSYFRDNFNLPHLPNKINEQIIEVRKFLEVSSLNVFKQKDMYVNFRSPEKMSEISMIKANIMVQIASNISLKNTDIPCYNKKKFLEAINYAISNTNKYEDYINHVKIEFFKAGVDLIILPNIKGSKINGATKKIGNHIMLFVNDRGAYYDTFLFTLFHEIGHIINADYGISFIDDTGDIEKVANEFAEKLLIPEEDYQNFIKNNNFTRESIIHFAKFINRHPSVIVGRLQNDKKISYTNKDINSLKKKCSFSNTIK